MLTLPENAKFVEALTPSADAAGRTGTYVSLKNAGNCFVVVNINQGNAATVAITIEQAKAVAGTGSKAITKPIPIWANIDSSVSDALVRASDDVSYTTDAGTKKKIIVFQIEPRSLDVNNGFTSIVVKTGASNVANITQAMYILTDLRYQGSSTPSAIVD